MLYCRHIISLSVRLSVFSFCLLISLIVNIFFFVPDCLFISYLFFHLLPSYDSLSSFLWCLDGTVLKGEECVSSAKMTFKPLRGASGMFSLFLSKYKGLFTVRRAPREELAHAEIFRQGGVRGH